VSENTRKARIVRIGRIVEKADGVRMAVGWAFDGGDAPGVDLRGTEALSGGYTLDELSAIAESGAYPDA